MGFASETGYVPLSVEELMEIVRANINAQFATTYTKDDFVGTNFYKYFYALIQRLQENEVKTAEIFAQMQQYFVTTNEKVLRPNTTHPGIYDYFLSKGYLASTKAPADVDAGKAYICVDVKDNHARGKATITSYANLVSGTDDSIQVGATVFTAQTGAATLGTATFQAAGSNALTATSLALQINAHATAGALVTAWAVDTVVHIRAKLIGTAGNAIALIYADHDTNVGATVSGATLLGGVAIAGDDVDYNTTRLEICNLVKDCVVAGVISQGSEIETITLANSQSFDFKFNLPDRQPIKIRLTITQSENNLFVVGDTIVVQQLLYDKIVANYKLGKNFEPQRYFSVVDAPWAESVLLEWKLDDGIDTYKSTVFDADYDDLLTFDLDDITIVEA